jgi:hypothetical protein
VPADTDAALPPALPSVFFPHLAACHPRYSETEAKPGTPPNEASTWKPAGNALSPRGVDVAEPDRVRAKAGYPARSPPAHAAQLSQSFTLSTTGHHRCSTSIDNCSSLRTSFIRSAINRSTPVMQNAMTKDSKDHCARPARQLNINRLQSVAVYPSRSGAIAWSNRHSNRPVALCWRRAPSGVGRLLDAVVTLARGSPFATQPPRRQLLTGCGTPPARRP